MARKFLVKNMGSVDRALRAFVITPAAIIAAVAFGASSIGGIVLFVVAGIALPTAAVSRCPELCAVRDRHARRRPRAHATPALTHSHYPVTPSILTGTTVTLAGVGADRSEGS